MLQDEMWRLLICRQAVQTIAYNTSTRRQFQSEIENNVCQAEP
jgi:hypothetical protein